MSAVNLSDAWCSFEVHSYLIAIHCWNINFYLLTYWPFECQSATNPPNVNTGDVIKCCLIRDTEQWQINYSNGGIVISNGKRKKLGEEPATQLLLLNATWSYPLLNHSWRSEKLRERGHLGRPRRRWEDNIRVDNQEIVWEGVCWIELDEDTDGWRNAVNTWMKLGVS